MNHDSESGSARRGGATFPTLLERELRKPLLSLTDRAQQALGAETGGLLHFQTRFIEHYFRLQRAERNLSSLVQPRKPGGGTSIVRQIERERERLGRELHTGVGQLLVAIKLQVEVITAHVSNPAAAVDRALEKISQLASDAQEQVRSISRRLHPPEWQRLTLESAIQQLWDNSGVPQAYEASLQIEPLPREPEQEVKVLVYRAVQEALSNLTSHAHATRIELTLRAQGDSVILTIQDNGVGFDAARLFAAPANVASGIGLRSIREQAAALGGEFRITSGPQGTKLELTAPFVPLE